MRAVVTFGELQCSYNSAFCFSDNAIKYLHLYTRARVVIQSALFRDFFFLIRWDAFPTFVSKLVAPFLCRVYHTVMCLRSCDEAGICFDKKRSFCLPPPLSRTIIQLLVKKKKKNYLLERIPQKGYLIGTGFHFFFFGPPLHTQSGFYFSHFSLSLLLAVFYPRHGRIRHNTTPVDNHTIHCHLYTYHISFSFTFFTPFFPLSHSLHSLTQIRLNTYALHTMCPPPSCTVDRITDVCAFRFRSL